MSVEDLTGQIFNRLTVVSRAENEVRNGAVFIKWNCICECGVERVVRAGNLKSGNTKSCGCKQGTHKMTGKPEYIVWSMMKRRCISPTPREKANYKDKGITVCERWLKFENFYEDMGPRPKDMTLDRINNDLGYFKENCRWASRETQARNTGMFKTNTSGFKGVSWDKARNKWLAFIVVKDKMVNIGLFEDKNDAVFARLVAEENYWGVDNTDAKNSLGRY